MKTASNPGALPETRLTAPWSARTLLVGLVVACLLPASIGTVAMVMHEYREARERLDSDTLQTTRALSQAVDHQILQVKALAQGLSTSDALIEGDLAKFHRQARETLRRADLSPSVVLFNRGDQQVLNTLKEYGEHLPGSGNPELLRQVFRTGQPAVSNLYKAPVLGRQIMAVVVPVFIGAEVRYVLGASIFPERFNALLRAQDIPPDRKVSVLDSTGTVAGTSSDAPPRVGTKVEEAFRQRFLSGAEGKTETIESGIPVVCFFSRSSATGWGVSIDISRKALGATLRDDFSSLALGGVALLALGLGLAWALGERIARSFQALVPPASTLGSGSTTVFPSVNVKEAAQVVEALREAADVLRARDAALRQAAQTVEDSERKYRSLFSNMTEGFGLAEPIFDDRGRPVDVRLVETNDAFHRQIGLPKSVLGRPLRAQLPQSEEFWIERFGAVFLTGKSQRFDGYDRDTRHFYDVFLYSPARGQVAVLLRDMSRQKRMEIALRESEDYLKHLISSLPGTVWTATPDGAIDFLSEQWVAYTGERVESQYGEKFIEAIHPDDRDNLVRLRREAMKNGTEFRAEYRLRRQDGIYQWFNSVGAPMRDANGNITRWLGIVTSIHELKTAQEILRREQSTLQAILDNTPAIITVKDTDGKMLVANKAMFDFIDVPPPERFIGRSVFELFPREQAAETWEGDQRAVAAKEPIQAEERVQHRDGAWHVYLTTRFPVRDVESGNTIGIGTISIDITDRKKAEEQARNAVQHDALTGLPNRALIFEYGGRLVAGAARKHTHGALLFVDLDRFKPINDLYGHETGDAVLKEVARRLVACTRAEDLVGRLGGDEFVIVLPHLDQGHHRAGIVAQHVIDSICEPFRVGTLELSLSPSIGISLFPEHSAEVGTLIRAADLAMYQVKQSGRASYQFYSPELDRHAEQSYALEARLKKALKEGGLALHYQPVLDIASGKLMGCEALLRLSDGDPEAVGPATFIPVAEAAGLIGEMGEWVATEAYRQHRAWLGEGLQVPIAINVSPLQFRQRDFADRLIGILSGADIDPGFLQLEVTESTLMENFDDAKKVLDRIKSTGVKVALDDFGTGYSSLSRLSTLPFDKLKVDQSFVRGIASDQASRAVTDAIIALARSLKLEVIGEGIESADTLAYLKEHGCDEAQGFWFSEALPPAEFFAWCRQRAAAMA